MGGWADGTGSRAGGDEVQWGTKKLELRMEMALKGCQAAAKVIRWVGSEESGNP